MKVRAGTGLAAIGLLVALVSAISTGTKWGSKQMTQTEILGILTHSLETRKELHLEKLDCHLLFGPATTAGSSCYSSTITPEAARTALQKVLAPLGSTSGWRDDYAVYGAFYAMKADPKMTFGVTVERVENALDLEGVQAVKGKKTVITVIVNSQRKP